LLDKPVNAKNKIHLAVLEGVDWKILCLKFILEVRNHSFSELAIRKIYDSGALNFILDNKLPEAGKE
jgi:hypothetical protein